MERQAAGDGERARIVLRDAELVARDLHRGRKAGIDVDVRDFVHGQVGHLEGLAPHGADRDRGVVVLTVQHVPELGRICTPVQVHPLLLGHTEFLRVLHRRQEQGGTLVDLVHGVHELGVGPAHEAVRRRRGGDLVRAALDRIPG